MKRKGRKKKKEINHIRKIFNRFVKCYTIIQKSNLIQRKKREREKDKSNFP